MNTDFTTHNIEEKPQIFILGGSDQLSLAINHVFTSHGFATVFFNTDEDIDELKVKNFLSEDKSIYKTIWIDLDREIVNKDNQWILELLQKRPEPLIYFTRYSHIENTFNFAAKKQENFNLGALKIRASGQKTILIQDYISVDRLFSPWKEVFLKLKHKILLDPKTVFYPTTIELIKKKLEKILFSPNSSEFVLLRGGKTQSGDLLPQLSDFFEKNFGEKLEIKSAPYISRETEGISFDKLLELSSPINEQVLFLAQAVKNKAKNNKKKENKNTVQSKTIEVSGSAVVRPLVSLPVKPRTKLNSIKKTPPPAPPKPEGRQEPPGQKEIEKEIKSVFNQERVQKKAKKVAKKIIKTKTITKKQKRRRLVFFLGLFVFGATVGFLSLVGVFLLSNKVQNDGLYAQISGFGSEPVEISQKLEKASMITSVQYLTYSSLFPKQWFVETKKNLSLYQFLKNQQKLEVKKLRNSQDLASFIFSQEDGSEKGSLSQKIRALQLSSDELLNHLSTFQIKLESDFDPDDKGRKILEQKILVQKKQLQASSQFLEYLPEALGVTGQKNYLLLLQNNMELKPSGGSIESMALLSFEAGVLKNYQVFNMSALEKNTKGKREAPADFQKILGRKNIDAQDSSWFLDFSNVSKELEKQSEPVFGKNIDGVLAINLISVENILKKMGPLDVGLYNEQVSSENLMEKVYFQASTDLNAKLGKDSYFTALFKSFLNNMFEEFASQDLLKTLPQLAKEKQLYFDMSGPALFDNLAWSGKIFQPLCPLPFRQDCQIDSIFQTETNIAANYSNLFVDRSIKHSIILEKDFAKHSRVILFKNSSSSASWPGGTYKTYLRFMVDEGSELEYIEFSGEKIDKDMVIISSESNKKIWGLVLELAPSEEKELLLKYRVPLKNQLSYGFFDQKQSGTNRDPLVVELSHSPTLSPSIIAPQAEVFGNKLRFSFLRESDSLIMLQFK